MYDALNVLLAMKIMHKDGKAIRWTGMPANMQEECRKLEVPRFAFLRCVLRGFIQVLETRGV